jgi:hypothetical protein
VVHSLQQLFTSRLEAVIRSGLSSGVLGESPRQGKSWSTRIGIAAEFVSEEAAKVSPTGPVRTYIDPRIALPSNGSARGSR